MPNETAAKRESFNKMMALNGVVMIHVNPKVTGVMLPDDLLEQTQVHLNFNHQKGKGDLVIEDWGIQETLRFEGVWVTCSVPWRAIFAISIPGRDPVAFMEGLPESFATQDDMDEATPSIPKKSGLRLVK